MRTYVLCRAAFSDAYVARILAATPPGWHVTQTWRDINAAETRSNVLFVVGGSPRSQKTQTLRIRFGGGAAAGAFQLPLAGFQAFLISLNREAPQDESGCRLNRGSNCEA